METPINIRAIIVDDEPSAIEALTGMLASFCPQVDIVGAATSVHKGAELVRQLMPDLVFLDIEIPPFGKGFDLLVKTAGISYGVIFTTAYPQYAVQAINEVQPWGYIIKPYRVADLVKSVHIALEKMPKTSVTATASDEPQGLIIPDNRLGRIVLHVPQILYCESDQGTSDIYFIRDDKVEKCISSRSLKELEAELPTPLFCRTHHKYLVNLAHILHYKRTGRNGIIQLRHGCTVGISVVKMDHFESKFKTFLKSR